MYSEGNTVDEGTADPGFFAGWEEACDEVVDSIGEELSTLPQTEGYSAIRHGLAWARDLALSLKARGGPKTTQNTSDAPDAPQSQPEPLPTMEELDRAFDCCWHLWNIIKGMGQGLDQTEDGAFGAFQQEGRRKMCALLEEIEEKYGRIWQKQNSTFQAKTGEVG